MRIPLSLGRRRPAPKDVSIPGFEREPEDVGTPWTPEGSVVPQGLPLSATVVERSEGVRVSEADRAVYQAVSLLLDYPDQNLIDALPLIRDAVAESMRGAAAMHVLALVEHLESTDLAEAQRHYVETFDMRRRCSLHLTYYAYGDTRRRGMALLDLKQTYQSRGVTLTDDELPDHVCVMLSFAAGVDPAVGRTLLMDHRPGLELLRISLSDRGSVYAHAIEAVSATLPALVGRDRDAVRSLIASGPPDEQVGMEAFMSGSHASSGARV